MSTTSAGTSPTLGAITTGPALQLRNITLGFVGPRVWTGGGRRRDTIAEFVQLTVNAGQIVGIVGKNGSGKSTLLEVAGGIRQPLSGDVYWGEHNLSEQSAGTVTRLRASLVRLVTQGDSLVGWLSPAENLQLQAEAAGLRLTRARALELLREVDLGDRALRAGQCHHLSGGEKHRVILARALVGQPRLILADEPTGSLDQESGQTVAELLLDLPRRTKAALVVVTHDRDLAAQLPTVYQLAGHRLAEQSAA